ncbi:hypothetical protein H354_00560 [Streptococcus oralis subsp. tigurinus AZ_3a]|nr:hypothetical protein H354_00560 [Streptococcus oralis subsp. tigurinus AZ_3a]
MLECSELQLMKEEKYEKYNRILKLGLCVAFVLTLSGCSQSQKDSEKSPVKSEFTQSSATYSNLNSQTSFEEVKNLLSTHTIIRRKQVKELNL